MKFKRWFQGAFLGACGIGCASGYEQKIGDTDSTRQVCSGMYGGSIAHINVTFDSSSSGQLAMAIYEWQDVKYLGKDTYGDDNQPKTYVCTSDAVTGGYCTREELGQFIIDLPGQLTINSTSIWSRRVIFPGHLSKSDSPVEGNGFWDNPAGNPTPTDTEYASPWKRTPAPVYNEGETDTWTGDFHIMETDTAAPPSATSVPSRATESGGNLHYHDPITYPVPKTGYYCVAMIPLTVMDMRRDNSTEVPNHPKYSGTVLFRNTFNGQLSAAEYPKVNFYLGLTLAYLVLGGLWGYLCYRHMADLLPIQYYISYLAGFLVIEMVANWGYYRFVNAHGMGVSTSAFLVVVTILDSGRNALSFFLLLVVSLGLSVVRESLGPTMKKAKILTGLHFAFGVLYSTGLVYLDLESTAGLVLLMFVIPLALTLSSFLLWIMHGLSGTIAELRQRKQRYKLRMFRRLQLILIGAVIIIAAFFVLSSMSFSDRMSEDFAPNSWRWRWWLIDGYLALLYLVVFVSTAYLWRPTGSNRRLAMSDELAQDEEDAEDYDLDALESRGQPHPLNADGIPEAPRSGRRGVGDDETVFEIGEEEDDEDGRGRTPLSRGQRPKPRTSDEGPRDEHEHEGLMGQSSSERR